MQCQLFAILRCVMCWNVHEDFSDSVANASNWLHPQARAMTHEQKPKQKLHFKFSTIKLDVVGTVYTKFQLTPYLLLKSVAVGEFTFILRPVAQ